MTELALSASLAPEQKEQLETVTQSAAHLVRILLLTSPPVTLSFAPPHPLPTRLRQLAIVNDILDISKIEAGEMVLHVEPFSLRGVVGGVVRMLNGKARLKGISLTASVDKAVPAQLMGDSSRLRQCVVSRS